MGIFKSISEGFKDLTKSVKKAFGYEVSDYKTSDDIDEELYIDEELDKQDEFITDDYLKEDDKSIDIEHIDYSDTNDYSGYEKIGTDIFDFFKDIFRKPKKYVSGDITVESTKDKEYETWLISQESVNMQTWGFFKDIFNDKMGTP